EICDRFARQQQFIRSLGIHEFANGIKSSHYEFRHSLYRQALYRRLSSINRSQLHRVLAECLKPICDAGKPELAPELALHFEQGREYELAARYLVLAAGNDTRRFAHGDSIRVI